MAQIPHEFLQLGHSLDQRIACFWRPPVHETTGIFIDALKGQSLTAGTWFCLGTSYFSLSANSARQISGRPLRSVRQKAGTGSCLIRRTHLCSNADKIPVIVTLTDLFAGDILYQTPTSDSNAMEEYFSSVRSPEGFCVRASAPPQSRGAPGLCKMLKLSFRLLFSGLSRLSLGFYFQM